MSLIEIVDLGVSARVKYGFLLDKMKGKLPVFRTETQEWVMPILWQKHADGSVEC